jgi:hypothetical protein
MTDKDETTSVRITQTVIYQKQLEMLQVQVQILSKLDNLRDVPERLRQVELTLARLAWIERVAYSALTAAIIALISAVLVQINS